MSNTDPNGLSALAFGANAALHFDQPRHFAESLAPMLPGLKRLRHLDRSEKPFYSISTLDLHDIRLAAVAHSSIRVEREPLLLLRTIFPLSGGYEYVWRRSTAISHPDGTAFVDFTDDLRETSGPISNGIVLSLSAERLARTIDSMSGEGARLEPLEGVISGKIVRGEVDFARRFAAIGRQIEASLALPRLVRMLALEERVYRTMAVFVRPELSDPPTGNRRPLRREIAQLCEYMRANLTEPINLTTMERISGLSARLLQYAFRRSFGLTPIEWLRRERLYAARRLIIEQGREASVTTIALEFGFSPSQFAVYYRALFHERPSDTRART